LFSDGEWFCWVRVEDPVPAGLWSPISRFIKIWAIPENKPSLLAPLEGQAMAFFDSPSFSWTRVMGAARYRIQIATDPGDLMDPILSVDSLTDFFQPPGRLANGVYYWRVLALDATDHPGTPSNIQLFIATYGNQSVPGMVPTLVNPEDESFPTFTPAFHWTAIEGAEYYRLETLQTNLAILTLEPAWRLA
jgi:hypothetical protein